MADDKVIKDAQYRKGLSIAFFNATNAAINLLSAPRVLFESITPEQTKMKIVEIRDWLLDEHKKYYAEVIAQVGVSYKAADAIKRLEAVTSMVELKTVWVQLSEDERRDGEIIKACQSMKSKYEKA
jgi:hypothetical protein